MKFNTLTRFAVVSLTILGTVVVATSQPGSKNQQGGTWPTHRMIPAKVGLDQLQEFKDAATLHLNDIQKFGPSVGNDGTARGIPSKVAISKTFTKDFFTEIVIVIKDAVASSPGGGIPVVKRVTPAELAMLYYAFDQGVDMMKKGGSMSTLQATPLNISGHLSPKEMGMTDGQFRQMTTVYVETHHMRFWNEARVGLTSGG